MSDNVLSSLLCMTPFRSVFSCGTFGKCLILQPPDQSLAKGFGRRKKPVETISERVSFSPLIHPPYFGNRYWYASIPVTQWFGERETDKIKTRLTKNNSWCQFARQKVMLRHGFSQMTEPHKGINEMDDTVVTALGQQP